MKNDNKKKIVAFIIIAIVLGLIIGIAIYKTSDSKKAKEPSSNNLGTENIVTTQINYPKFTVIIDGLYEGFINERNLVSHEIPQYKFKATVKNSWDTHTNEYDGIKLTDVFEKMGFTKYSRVEFKGIGDNCVIYNKDEIDDNLYFVFYRDGKPIEEDIQISLLNPQKNYRYSVENLIKIVFS